MADFVVIANDDNGTPVRGFFTPSVAVPDPPPPPATDAMDPIYPNLDVPGSYASVVTSTFSYTNLPSYVTWVATYFAFASAHGRVFEVTAGAAPNGTTAATQLVLPDASTSTLVETTLFGDQFGQQLIYQARGPAATPYSLDVGSALLPAYASAPTYDPDRRMVSWTEGTGAQVPNVVRARIHAYRDAIPEGRAWGWRIIAPRTATTVTYPQVPVFGFDFNVQATDVVGVDELTTAEVPGGYAAVRRIGFGDLSSVLLGTTDSLILQTLVDMML
jgi:hypothetical protein